MLVSVASRRLSLKSHQHVMRKKIATLTLTTLAWSTLAHESSPRMREQFGWSRPRRNVPGDDIEISASNTLFRQSRHPNERNRPRYHIAETDTNVTLFLDLPHRLQLKDVNVHILDDNTLTVRGYGVGRFEACKRILSPTALSSSSIPSSSLHHQFTLDTSVLDVRSLQVSGDGNILQVMFNKKAELSKVDDQRRKPLPSIMEILPESSKEDGMNRKEYSIGMALEVVE
jgi:HSP20 family molecular chaperone IbpA